MSIRPMTTVQIVTDMGVRCRKWRDEKGLMRGGGRNEFATVNCGTRKIRTKQWG
jgi:hypothetical protein